MESTNKDCSKKISPYVAGILGASLVANLFLVGIVTVSLMKMHGCHQQQMMGQHMPPPPPGIAFMIKRIEPELSPQDVAAVKELATKTDTDLESSTKERDAAFAELGTALKANPVDDSAIQKALDDVSAAHAKTEAAMSGFVKEAASKLSPEGRKVLAEKGLPPPHNHMGPHDGMPGMDMHGDGGRGFMPPDGPPPGDMPPGNAPQLPQADEKPATPAP